MRMQKKYWARSPPERFSEISKNFQEAEMDKYNDELKMQFSAYVKQSILNRRGQYLRKNTGLKVLK